MVEKGVRMVQIYHGNSQPWDNHDDILTHRKLAREADPAIGSLIEDLRARDMLDRDSNEWRRAMDIVFASGATAADVEDLERRQQRDRPATLAPAS